MTTENNQIPLEDACENVTLPRSEFQKYARVLGLTVQKQVISMNMKSVVDLKKRLSKRGRKKTGW